MGANIEPLPLTQPALGRGRSLEESRATNREKPPGKGNDHGATMDLLGKNEQ